MIRSLAAASLVLALAGCSTGGAPRPDASSLPSAGSPSSSSSASASGSAPRAIPLTPVPVPEPGQCHRLTWEQALATSAPARAVPCGRPHTSQTYAVGRLDLVVDGHLLAVDSEHARRQAAKACPRRLEEFLGGTEEQRRLTMLRAVWFAPTIDQADAGADWYRCDVIGVAAEGRLARITRPLRGVLGEGGEDLAMCGTAEPGTADFARVACGEPHTWRAVSTVDLPAGDYPGTEAARAAGEEPCREAAEAVAEDALDYQWGYEWPTAEQWRDGQRWGICWAPEPGGD